MDRKTFLRTLLATTAGLACPYPARGQGEGEGAAVPAPAAPRALPRRELGGTGAQVTTLGLGGFHLGRCASEKEARALVDVALEEGVRFFDNAESYQSGQAERWMGAALEGSRDDVFLMSKTFSHPDRTAESAKRHLEGTLERLRTDRLDLWQLHSVRSVEDVDRAFGEGGAMRTILEMQAQGVVTHVGVTGHTDPAANLRAIEHHRAGLRFDCMQMPLNPLDPHQRSFQRAVLPVLVAERIGVLAMKTSAQGRLVEDGLCTIEECLRYAWSLPVSVAIVGMETPEQVRQNARLARACAAPEQALDADAAEALVARLAPRASLELEWYKR